MDILRKFACFIIGWKYDTLKNCSEASTKKLYEYIGALIIMVILWSTIGYVFAERYLHLESNCFIVALAFATIIFSIERIIILNVGKNKLMGGMRVCLAVCIAILGAFIFDQVIFSDDLKKEIAFQRENVIVKEVIKARQNTLNMTINSLSLQNDSLGQVNERLNNEILKEPASIITTRTVKNVQIGTDSVGNPIYEKKVDYTQISQPNPKNEDVLANSRTRESNLAKINDLRDQLQQVDKQVREEYLNEESERYIKVGFMEELDATITVVFKSWITIVFYAVLFFFMIFLEVLVLSIKMSRKCDYDILIESQLEQKEIEIAASLKKLKENAKLGLNTDIGIELDMQTKN